MLRWLISAVGFAALKGELSAMARRATMRALLATLALLLWLAAFCFAVAAFAVWLATQLGPIAACAIIAAGLAVIGLIIQVALAIAARRRRNSGLKVSLPGVSADSEGISMPNLGALGSMAVVGIAGYLIIRQLFRK